MVSRYGLKIRRREQAILRTQRAHYQCPSCGKPRLRRASFALWRCGACGLRMAGGAYAPTTPIGETAKKTIEKILRERAAALASAG